MTAPPHRPSPDRKAELTVARRRDVRRLAAFGPPDAELPPVHAGPRDPRYPSPATLRQFLGFFIDLLLHLGLGVATFFVLGQRQPAGTALFAGVGVFFGLSLVDRIVVQRLCRASAGKLITDLRVLRDDTGGPPTVWLLVKQCFTGFGMALSLLTT